MVNHDRNRRFQASRKSDFRASKISPRSRIAQKLAAGPESPTLIRRSHRDVLAQKQVDG